MSTIPAHPSLIVGDRVRIDFGRRKVGGVIVEDRGPIGVRGRRLFQIEIPMDPFESMMVELPEEEIEPVKPGEESAVSMDKEKVREYLKNGGLISILQSNLAGGMNQPRVWLRPDNLGNVTHTFIPERGVIGGQVVPFRAVQGDKIFAAKRDSVVSFLESFGLSHEEANKLASEVGTTR